MVWTQVAVFDTEENIAEFEEVELFRDSWSSNMRCVNIVEEGEYLIEEKTEDEEISGWARIATLDVQYGEAPNVVEGYGGIESDEYRLIYNYDSERYEIERYYNND